MIKQARNPYTPEQKLKREVEMFGYPIAELEALKSPHTSNAMYAMMILSDVQDMIIQNSSRERIMQNINQAKYFIGKGIKR